MKVIKQHLGSVQVDRLTRSHIKGFIAMFNDWPHTKKEYLNELRGIIDIAMDDEVIQVNQARNIKVRKLDKPDIDPFSPEEVISIMAHAKALYLFDKNGGYLGDSGYFRRQWKTVLKDAEVRYRKLYNTRHTFITAMLNSGQFSILQIAQMVGHASPRMIMSTYASFVKSEHLKIDVKTDLFGHNTSTVEKQVKSYEFGKSAKSS